MMREEVIIQQLSIDRIGKKIYFQIRLPRDAKRIIGLEFGTMEKDGTKIPGAGGSPFVPFTKFSANKVIGDITMQVPGNENIFFQHCIIEDRNITLGEQIATDAWKPQLWVHHTKRLEMCLSVNRYASIDRL